MLIRKVDQNIYKYKYKYVGVIPSGFIFVS